MHTLLWEPLLLRVGGASGGQLKAKTVNFSFNGSSQQAELPTNISSYEGLLDFARRTFNQQVCPPRGDIDNGATAHTCAAAVMSLAEQLG